MQDVKLLEDHSLEIPPFLQRNEDGSFAHPDVAIPVSVAVTLTREENRQLDRWGWPVNPDDERAKREILMQQQRANAERSAESGKVTRQKRAEQRMIKDKQLIAGRKNFIQQFKWDFNG